MEEAREMAEFVLPPEEPEGGSAPEGAAPPEITDYAAARGMQRYESAEMLLNTLREMSARQELGQAPAKVIEIIETARPVKR